MDAVSIFGLFFAAVAAWGAMQSTRLTRQIGDEADRRRLVEALVGVQWAADALRTRPNSWLAVDVTTRFSCAQEEVARARSIAP